MKNPNWSVDRGRSWTAMAPKRPGLAVSPVDSGRLRQARFSPASRVIPTKSMATLITSNLVPQTGDLVLVRIDHAPGRAGDRMSEIDPWGNPNRVGLQRGDEAVLCYGAVTNGNTRDIELPASLCPCHIIAEEGLAGRVPASNSAIATLPSVTPLGFIGDVEGRVINLRTWDCSEHGPSTPTGLEALPEPEETRPRCHAV